MSPATEAEVAVRDCSNGSALAEFEQIYRDNVASVTSYFSRHISDPQTVADLTSETIVRAIGAFAGFDSGRGTARTWLFGIARHVYVRHCEQTSNGREAVTRLAGLAVLPVNEIEELTQKIDTQREWGEWLKRCAGLSELERSAVELVDLDGFTPKEAAAALGVTRGVLRMRLSRARTRLRKEHGSDAYVRRSSLA